MIKLLMRKETGTQNVDIIKEKSKIILVIKLRNISRVIKMLVNICMITCPTCGSQRLQLKKRMII